MNTNHVWIDRLTASFSLKHALLPFRTIIFYSNSATSLAQKILTVAEKIPFLSVSLIQVTDHISRPDANGAALIYQLEAKLACLSENLLKNQNPGTWLPPALRNYSDEMVRLTKAQYIHSIRDHLIFQIFREWAYETGNFKLPRNGRVIVYLRNPAPKHMATVLKEKINGTPIQYKRRLIDCFSDKFYPIIKLAQYSFRATKYAFHSPSDADFYAPTTTNKKNLMLVQYASGDMHKYPTSGIFSWAAEDSIEKESILFYFNRYDSPCNIENKQRIQNIGAGWLDGSNLDAFLKYPCRAYLRTIKNAWQLFPWSFASLDIWLWSIAIRGNIQTTCFKNLLQQYNIKGIHQHDEIGAYTGAFLIGAQMADAAFFWSHWSVYHFPISRDKYVFTDVLFSWGPYSTGYFKAIGSRQSYNVETGVVGGDGHSDAEPNSNNLLEETLSPNLSFKLALFDSSVAPQYSMESLLEFYIWLIDILKKHPNWGCYLKPKSIAGMRVIAKNSDLKKTFNQLEKAGQIKILNPKERISIAAKAADLSICFAINSAGVLADQAGGAAIHVDLHHSVHHPFYTDKKSSAFIVHSKSQLEELISAAALGDKSIGHHGIWRNRIDPFLDNRGNQRMGEFIGNYFRSCNNGRNKNAALKEAAQSYAGNWGYDRVKDNKFDNQNISAETKMWQKIIKQSKFDQSLPQSPSN